MGEIFRWAEAVNAAIAPLVGLAVSMTALISLAVLFWRIRRELGRLRVQRDAERAERAAERERETVREEALTRLVEHELPNGHTGDSLKTQVEETRQGVRRLLEWQTAHEDLHEQHQDADEERTRRLEMAITELRGRLDGRAEVVQILRPQ